MYSSQEIAERIKQQALQQGKSLATVLSECGLGKNTISKISKGTDVLTLNFAKIADNLNCSVDYLLGRDEQKEKPAPKEGSRLTDDQRYLIDAIYNMSSANVKKLRIIVDQVIAEREK